MYLSEHRRLRMFVMCALYFAQGVPWGFVTITLAAWIASNGFSAEQIGPILGVATLPWSFKFLWGPVIDRFSDGDMGRRRPWILVAQFTSITILTSLAFLGDLDAMIGQAAHDGHSLRQVLLSPLAMIVFLANVCISLQDVSVDALAVDLLPESERGRANGFMYGASYLGTAAGGAGLGYVVGRFGINAGIIGQALLLTMISLLPMFLLERHGDKFLPFGIGGNRRKAAAMQIKEVRRKDSASMLTLAKLLWRAFTIRSSVLGLVLAFTAKIGLGVLTAVLVSYLINSGRWTQAQYTALNGGVAVFAGMAGTLVGGFAADLRGTRFVLCSTTSVLAGLWMSFAIFPNLMDSFEATSLLLVAQEFLFASISVSLFAMFMTLSWPRVAATQFTTYMSCMNLSSTIGSFVAGKLSQNMSIAGIMLVAAVIQMVSLIPVVFLDPGEARRRLGD